MHAKTTDTWWQNALREIVATFLFQTPKYVRRCGFHPLLACRKSASFASIHIAASSHETHSGSFLFNRVTLVLICFNSGDSVSTRLKFSPPFSSQDSQRLSASPARQPPQESWKLTDMAPHPRAYAHCSSSLRQSAHHHCCQALPVLP